MSDQRSAWLSNLLQPRASLPGRVVAGGGGRSRRRLVKPMGFTRAGSTLAPPPLLVFSPVGGQKTMCEKNARKFPSNLQYDSLIKTVILETSVCKTKICRGQKLARSRAACPPRRRRGGGAHWGRGDGVSARERGENFFIYARFCKDLG